jgi:hypothetical protein
MWYLRGFVVVETSRLPMEGIHLDARMDWDATLDE